MRQRLPQQFHIAKSVARDVGEGVMKHILAVQAYCPAEPEVGLKSISSA